MEDVDVLLKLVTMAARMAWTVIHKKRDVDGGLKNN
jgi:hypothetical protein